MKYPWLEASNENNIFDKIGFVYNLSAVSSIRTVGNNIQTILPVTITSVKNHLEESDFDSFKFINDFPWGALSMLIKDVENKFQNIIVNLKVENSTKQILSDLIDIIYNFENYWSDYNLMKELILNVENNINELYEQDRIPEDEFMKLSSACSLVRFGSLFYNENLPDPFSMGKENYQSQLRKGTFWKILGAIACAALSIFLIGPAVVGGALSTAGTIYYGVMGFAGGWFGVGWGLNGFPF